MTIKSPILLFLWLLLSTLSLHAELTVAPFENTLPSEQTEQEILMLSESPSDQSLPQLRARPTDVPETERPQKIPLGDVKWSDALILSFLLIIYSTTSRKYKSRLKELFAKNRFGKNIGIFAVLCISANALSAQIKAVPDNYFVEPGKTQFFQILSNDDPGTCSEILSDLDIELIASTLPDYNIDGVEVILSTNQRIRVRTRNTARGQVIFKYKISCKNDPSLTSETSVYINLAQRPDFIDAAICTTDRPKMVWDMEPKFISKELVNVFAFAIVGDVDADGDIEIVSTSANGSDHSHHVYIFDNELNLKYTITPPCWMDVYTVQAMAMADIDPVKDDGPELIIATGRTPYGGFPEEEKQKLLCYHYNHITGEWDLKWKSTEKIFSPYMTDTGGVAAPAYTTGTTISVADIDSDGLIEILAGDRVFSGGDRDGENGGQLLATMPEGGRGLVSWGVWGGGLAQGYFSSFGDIDGDGIQEIIAGNSTYKVSLNHDNPTMSSITNLVTMPYLDGMSSVADIDGDGILDVLTAGRAGAGNGYSEVYVWQGSSSDLIGQNKMNIGIRGSRIFAGDIDGDGLADFAMTRDSRFDAYKYDKATDSFSTMFTVPTSDTSGGTTMTMFDFDNDGKVELVYRDETHMRIIGKDPDTEAWGNLVAFPCYSNTHTEYPSVADIDGDGHAEIIVSGGTSSKTTVYMQVFGSITPGAWSPSRAVWHQHGYNPTMINEDLSVPQYPLSTTAEVMTKDGTVRRPYNSFLQQAGILNTEGDFINKAHDLAFLNRNQKLTYDDILDEMTVTAYFTNEGSVDFSGDILLGFYGYNSTTQTYDKITEEVFSAESVAIYEQKILNLTVSNYLSLPIYDRFYLTINLNEDGTNAPEPFYLDQDECISWNNLTSRFSYVSGRTVLCQNESGTLNIEPKGMYDCYWYTLDSGGNRVPYPSSINNMGDSQSVTKSAKDDADIYIIVPCKLGTLTPISITPDTAFVYIPMDSLIWTGAVDGDWHNTYNWSSPADPSVNQRFRYIPRGCTNVLIPAEDENGAALTIYPNISNTSTDYTTYADSRCNNITFEHGSEVVYIDHLIYSKAYVNVEMLANRWYTFAPPLRDFHSGDIYKDSPNPFTDNLEIYTRLYSQTDPEHGSYREGGWGAAFATPTYQSHVGQGFGVWINDHEPNPSTRANIQFSYPKLDTEYYMYFWDTGEVQSGPYLTNKVNPHRFIFEENFNTTTKEVKLQVEAQTIGKEILVGNPYMAHLDFDKFYDANSDKIEPYYKVIDEAYAYPTYYKDNPSGSTGTPRMTKDIAPMQAFIVTPKTAIDPATNPLITNSSMMLSSAGNTLRSTTKNAANIQNDYFKVSISDVMKRSKTSIIVDNSAKSDFVFDNNLDVMKTIKYGVKEYPVIYTITNDNNYTEIKSISSIKELSIPLGLCYEGTGPLALGFENMKAFAENYLNIDNGYHLYLEDKLEDRIIEITESSSIYSFNKSNNDTFTNDRFVLKITQSVMNIEEAETNRSIYATVKGNQLIVEDKSGESLEQVIVYNMHGVLICNTKTNDSSLSVTLNPGVYIVRVKDFITKVISE